MADLITIREWLRFILRLVGTFIVGALLLSWYAWHRIGQGFDNSSFLLAVSVSSALIILWLGLLVFYAGVRRMLRPSVRSQRMYKMMIGMLWTVLLAAFCCTFSYAYYQFTRQPSDVFEVVRLGDWSLLEEQIRANPALLEAVEAKEGPTLLQIAFEMNDPAGVEMLLKAGASPQQLLLAKKNPLVWSLDHQEILAMLLNRGFDPNACAADGIPPLQYAVVFQNMDAVRLLLNAGALPGGSDRSGRTALMRALEFENLDIAAYLVDHGAGVNEMDARGDSPLHKAVRQQNLGGIRLLLEHQCDPCVLNHAGFSPLHIAAINGQVQVVEHLLEVPGLIDHCNKEGQAAFDHAVRGKKYEVARLLLRQGVDINRRRHNGQAILHEMIAAADYRTVRFLVKEGADLTMTDARGETAYELLRQRNQLSVLN